MDIAIIPEEAHKNVSTMKSFTYTHVRMNRMSVLHDCLLFSDFFGLRRIYAQ